MAQVIRYELTGPKFSLSKVFRLPHLPELSEFVSYPSPRCDQCNGCSTARQCPSDLLPLFIDKNVSTYNPPPPPATPISPNPYPTLYNGFSKTAKRAHIQTAWTSKIPKILLQIFVLSNSNTGLWLLDRLSFQLLHIPLSFLPTWAKIQIGWIIPTFDIHMQFVSENI